MPGRGSQVCFGGQARLSPALVVRMLLCAWRGQCCSTSTTNAEDFDLKTIGDFIGHRSTRSTEVYAKVAVEALREVALGDGEAALA